MRTCKLLSCKCFLGLRGLFLRQPVKYVNSQKQDFHIFIEKFSFSTRKICCVHPQFSTEFELKGTIFEKKICSVLKYSECDPNERINSVLSAKDKRFIFAHLCDNTVLLILYTLCTLMI